MIGYIYMTTNLLNNKKYIGKHKAKQFEPDKYLGSSKLLTAAILKHGKEHFTCDLLQECFSIDELNEAEKQWIKQFDAVNSEEFYNLAYGGEGGNTMLNRIFINNGTIERRILPNEPIPEGFTRGSLPCTYGDKISEAKKGKPSKSKGKQWFNNGTEETMSTDCPEGWTHGRLNSGAWKNKSLYNNGIENRFFNNDEKIPNGWVKGALPGTIKSNTSGRIAYNNGISHIYLKKGEHPPEGFVKGYSSNRAKKCKPSKSVKGKRWYNNGVEQKYFAEDEDIPEGWIRGCCKKRNYN